MRTRTQPPDYQVEIGITARGVPILRCEQLPDNTRRVWCMYEQIYHFHGEGSGHRVAHCHEDSGSPYRKHGYIIVLPDEEVPA